MKTIILKVPEEQDKEIEEVIKLKHYTSKAEYIRDLIRRDIERHLTEFAVKEIKGGLKDIKEGRVKPLEAI